MDFNNKALIIIQKDAVCLVCKKYKNEILKKLNWGL